MVDKKLGFKVMLFILINSILGSSLFYLPSLGVISSGAASIIAWVALFILAGIMMMYVGELVSLHPTSGGTYEFCKRAYGRFGSFIAGWSIWIAGNFGMALNLVAAAQYFIPEQTTAAFYLQMIFVVMWIVVLNFMAYRGVDAGSIMLVTFGIIATVVVLLMTIPSFIDFPGLLTGSFGSPFNFSLLEPFFRHAGLEMWSYIGLSILLISEAVLGFEVVSYMANEYDKPEELHKVLLWGIGICGVIMSAYIFSSLGTVDYVSYVQDARPFAVQAFNNMGALGEQVVVFGMYLVIVGAAAAWPITGSRLLKAMANDKLFISQLAVLHPKHGTPHRIVYFQTVMVGLFSWILFRGYMVGWNDPYRSVYLIYVLISFFVLAMILLCVPILRRKEADLIRPFKAPFGTIGPILFVIGMVGLVVNWVWIEGGVAWTLMSLAGSFLVLGIPFYFLVEMFFDPNAIVKVNEKLSMITVLTEGMFFPISIRKKVLSLIGDVKGKVILEFGCAGGTLTKHLAGRVTETGRIIATDLSMGKVKVADKKTKDIAHVTVHHHPELHNFKFDVPPLDYIISVGMLSYMQNPQAILRKLGSQTKKGGKVLFIDYDKFFYLIPNAAWIQDKEGMIKIFANAGFKVTVEVKNGLLWQYVIVSGERV